MVAAFASRYMLPDGRALVKKVAQLSGCSEPEVFWHHNLSQGAFDSYDSSLTASAEGVADESEFDLIQRSTSGKRSSSVVGGWAHRVMNSDVTLSDIFVSQHWVSIDGFTESLKTEKVRCRGTYRLIPVHSAVAYHLLGLPESEWVSWSEIDAVNFDPGYIYRYKIEVAKFGVELTPDIYVSLMNGLRLCNQLQRPNFYGDGEFARRASLGQIKDLASMMRGAIHSGIDPNTIEDIGGWSADDWSVDSMVRFHRAGVKHVDAMTLYNQGLTDSDLIYRVLAESMPFEWAMNLKA